jgi:HAE1 family hydrophobic/amphiphilic exporter-1
VNEQSSFIEESISGVAREGSLGAFFAIVVILLFLSGGIWSGSTRRSVGVIMTAAFLVGLALVVLSNLSSANNNLGAAFAQTDAIVRILLILGAIGGLVVLLWPNRLPYPAWRSTLVTAVSIPLSILMALALMRWLPGEVHTVLAPSASSSPILTFVARLFPESVTLNIMTLSGLTVAIGRVVDDSIVVLENIFRQIQQIPTSTTDDEARRFKREAIISGTRDVSVAIFAATVVTVVVFLPLGMTGGIIGAFFLPFGLAVTYALASSFIVAITVVPVLVYLLVDAKDVTQEQQGRLAQVYQTALHWALASQRNRLTVVAVAVVSLIIGGLLFATRPTTFLPSLGEPQIEVSVNLPAGTKILDTNAKVTQIEAALRDVIPADQLKTVRTTVGGGGLSLASLIGGASSVDENVADLVVVLNSEKNSDALTQRLREQAEGIFGKGNVRVSAGTATGAGFGGFSLVLSGDQKDLEAVDSKVIETLNSVKGLTNASSNLSQIKAASGSGQSSTTYLRVNGQPAVSYSGELETENTLGVTQEAIKAVEKLPDVAAKNITVSQGFVSELQTQGFASLFVAMGIAMALVVIILMITFGSLVHWLDIMLSVIVAPVGAAVLLTLTNRVLGISALIGLLMLIGIVVTNAVVLIDRVQANRHERGMSVDDALLEAGGRRLRPILMTALATIMALIPLAIGLSKGAIIASELGTVVIGGLFSSTLLTLIVVPVAYRFLAPAHRRVASLLGRRVQVAVIEQR